MKIFATIMIVMLSCALVANHQYPEYGLYYAGLIVGCVAYPVLSFLIKLMFTLFISIFWKD